MTKECNPETCKICKKVGLSILPLRYGTVPVLNQDGGLNKMPNLPDELGAQVKDKRLKRHNYALRVIRQGYIYLLRYDKDSSQEWFGWEVTEDGYCVPFDPMNDPVPGKPQGPFVCSKKADNLPATMISVKDPETSPIVYMMFAEHPLTKKKLKEYQEDEHDALAMRMQFFSPMGFVASKGAGPGGIHTVKIDEIDKYAIDYNKAYFSFLAYKDKVTGVNGDQGLYSLYPRHYMVSELNKRFEKREGPYGIALALWDPVGITVELNYARNHLGGRAALVAGVGNEKLTRERIIADTIDGIRLNAEANPGPIWNKHFGPERFLKHIDQKKWEAACEVNKGFDEINKAFMEFSADYVKWKESNNWKWIARHEYDPTDHRSGSNFEKMVAASVVGSGVTKLERDEVWGKLWALQNSHPDNWLAAGLAGFYPDFQSFFDSNKNWYREYDTAKGLAGVVKDLTVKHAPKLVELHGKIRRQRAANDATAAIIETLTGVMLHLSDHNNEAYQKTMMSVTKTLIVRAGVIPKPILVSGTAADITQAVLEITAGKPGVKAPLTVNPNVPPTRGAYFAAKGNLGHRGLALSQAVQGAVVLNVPRGREQIREVAAWVVTHAQSGAHGLTSKDLRALELTNVDLSRPAANGSMRNPFLENQISRAGAKLDGVLGAGAFLFQVWTFQMMFVEFKKAKDADDGRAQVEYGESMLTAALSALSAGFEISAALKVLAGAPAPKVAFRITTAARFSAAASVIDGIYLVYKGIRIFKERGRENRECALWTMGSGVFLIAAGAASWQLGAVAAASVLAGTGVVAAGAAAGGAAAGTAGAGVAIFGGPVVWTLIVVSLVGGAMYMGWQAMVTDSTYLLPMEYWMDSGAFGLRKHITDAGAQNMAFYNEAKRGPFESLGRELEALQSIFLTSTGKLQVTGGFGTLTVNYEVATPSFNQGAVLVLQFFAWDKGRRVLVKTFTITYDEKVGKINQTKWHEKQSVLRDDEARTQVDHQFGMVTKGSFAMMAPPLNAKELAPGRAYAEQVELIATYAPSPRKYPGLITTFSDKA